MKKDQRNKLKVIFGFLIILGAILINVPGNNIAFSENATTNKATAPQTNNSSASDKISSYWNQSNRFGDEEPWNSPKIETLQNGELVVLSQGIVYRVPADGKPASVIRGGNTLRNSFVNSVYVDPSSRIYVNTNTTQQRDQGSPDVLISNDFGATWTPIVNLRPLLQEFPSSSSLIVDSYHWDSGILYLGVSVLCWNPEVREGLLVKYDPATGWSVIARNIRTSENDDIYIIMNIDKIGDRVVFTGMTGLCAGSCPGFRGAFVFYSNDSVNWIEAEVKVDHNSLETDDGKLYLRSHSGTLYWSAYEGKILSSTDSGATWSLLSTVNASYMRDAVEYYNGTSYVIVILHYGGGNVHISENGGISWSSLGNMQQAYVEDLKYVETWDRSLMNKNPSPYYKSLYVSGQDGLIWKLDTVLSTNNAPVIVNPGGRLVRPGETVVQTFDMSDPDGESIVPFMSNLPNGAVFNAETRTLTWVVPRDYCGDLSMLVGAVDSGGFSYQDYTVYTSVGCLPRLEITSLVDEPDPVRVGNYVTYTITVTNTSEIPLNGTATIEFMPDREYYYNAEYNWVFPYGTCEYWSTLERVECNFTNLAAGDYVVLEVNARAELVGTTRTTRANVFATGWTGDTVYQNTTIEPATQLY